VKRAKPGQEREAPVRRAPVRAPKKKKPRRPRGTKIRCPKCLWEPTKESRWQCTCGCVWNTFDTAGKCPDCGFQWLDTRCLSCLEWSKHVDWYENESPRS
jgi:hypothetical protein